MRNRDFRTVSALAALTLLGYSACAAGSDTHDPYPGPSVGGSGRGGTKSTAEAGAPADTAGAGGESDEPPGPGIDLGGAPPTSMGGGDGVETCAATVSKAELLPLDLYVMLDSSGSMDSAAPEGGTKWEAVKGALEGFITDESSSDIGVGIQYFPVDHPDVPEECTTNEQCGLAGQCALKWCWSYPQAIPCEEDADCSIYGPCVEVAQCSESGLDCYPAGNECSGENGTCTAWGGPSFCLHPSSCAVSAYATPDVPIAPLGENESALLDSLSEELPDGAYTTTGPAVRGALQHAVDYAEEHPGHTVAVVLATDGLPSEGECEPDDIASIATIVTQGRIGTPSVRTFVIGIFGQADQGAFENLTAIATAGGYPAFLVDSDSEDVTAAFSQALTEIRGAALTCEFKLPTAEDGESLDYGFVNVTVSNGDESLRLAYAGKEDDCDDEGGWYYDVNPSAGIPTRIIACPATCEGLQGSAENAVSIEVGCATVVK